MTSSFTQPGGTFASLFRAEPVMLADSQQAQLQKTKRGDSTPTHWVCLQGESLPDGVVPTPPTHPADYVGQIVAVATPVSANRT